MSLYCGKIGFYQGGKFHSLIDLYADNYNSLLKLAKQSLLDNLEQEVLSGEKFYLSDIEVFYESKRKLKKRKLF